LSALTDPVGGDADDLVEDLADAGRDLLFSQSHVRRTSFSLLT
jgi:hypothetical protein